MPSSSNDDLPASLQNLKPSTIQRFRDILDVPIQFDTPTQESTCQTVVDNLTAEEIQDIAKISYAYWALQQLNDDKASTEMAKKMVQKVARWHLEYLGSKHSKDHDAVIKRLRDAIQIRKDHHLDLFRTCFDKDHRTNADELSEKEIEIAQSIYEDLDRQKQFMRGHDKDGHPIYIKTPRMAPGTTELGYMNQQLFVAERSVAITEYTTYGKKDQVTAVISMKNQNSSYTPSLRTQIAAISLAQQLYPGRIRTILILDAPFLVRNVFNLLKPFLPASVSDSTYLLAGAAGTNKLKEVIGPDGDHQIFDNEHRDCKLNDPVDIDKYLFETPFYCPYGYDEDN